MKSSLLLVPALFMLSLSPVPGGPGQELLPRSGSSTAGAPPDAKTIYIRVAQTRYYRLDLGYSCSLLTDKGAHLITKTNGSDLVCSGADWDLAVSREHARKPADALHRQTMTPLSQGRSGRDPERVQAVTSPPHKGEVRFPSPCRLRRYFAAVRNHTRLTVARERLSA